MPRNIAGAELNLIKIFRSRYNIIVHCNNIQCNNRRHNNNYVKIKRVATVLLQQFIANFEKRDFNPKYGENI